MRAAQVFQQVINGLSPVALAATLAVSIALVIIACGLLLTRGKWRWLACGLGVVGLVTAMVVLILVDAQTTKSKETASVTVIRAKYSEGTRRMARAALIGLPALVLVVVLSVLASQRRSRRSRVPRQLKAGRKHLIQKEYGAALVEYNQAIQMAPHLAEAYHGRGCVYHAMGNAAHALADLDRAIQCDPRLASAYIERAKIRTENGDLDEALVDFGKLMVIRPNDPELFLNRGICLLKKGLLKDAAADFRRVLKLTNHTDYAEPAKNYLRQLEAQAEPHRPAVDGNGAPTATAMPQPRPTSMPQPKAEDYIL